MKHRVGDGRGRREVWLDGFLLDHVIECDDEAGTARVYVYPFEVFDDVRKQDVWQGCTLVVRSIGSPEKV